MEAEKLGKLYGTLKPGEGITDGAISSHIGRDIRAAMHIHGTAARYALNEFQVVIGRRNGSESYRMTNEEVSSHAQSSPRRTYRLAKRELKKLGTIPADQMTPEAHKATTANGMLAWVTSKKAQDRIATAVTVQNSKVDAAQCLEFLKMKE